MLRVNKKDVNKLMESLEDLPEDIQEVMVATFRDETPIRSGTARSKTRRTGKGVLADYPYADRLDNGWSKQAPDGMSTPAINAAMKYVDAFIRKED